LRRAGVCVKEITRPDFRYRGLRPLTEARNSTTLSGKKMTVRPSVLAEFERDMIRERVKAGSALSGAEGNGPGGTNGGDESRGGQAAPPEGLEQVGARELRISHASVIGMPG
jgi:DNA invertase Pin-like site-specific DNA recombinase